MATDLEEAIETLQEWAREKRTGFVKVSFREGGVRYINEETTRTPNVSPRSA